MTGEDLAARFGVRDLVVAIAETPPGHRGGPKAPWLERKEAYSEHAGRAGAAANRVALADELDNVRALVDLTPDILAQAEAGGRLIIHSSFFPGLWSVLRGRPELWPRTAIVFWGNDLIPVWRRPWVNGGLRPYLRLGILRVAARIRAEPPRKDREAVLPHLGAVCTLTPGEGEALDSRYGSLENRRVVVYPTHPGDLDLLPRSDPAEGICVIVGNSAHESGRQAEVLARLSGFRGEPMKVVCPLGYPASSPYKEDLLERGERLLGEQFEPLADMLSRDDYHRVLDAADVFVVNAHRQQGLYGIIYSLLRGTKVYLWEKSQTFRMLSDLGIRVFSVRELASCSFSEFRAFSDEDRRRNREIAARRFSLPAAVRCWKELLDDLETSSGRRGPAADEASPASVGPDAPQRF